MEKIRINVYEENGKSPFQIWLRNLDETTHTRIIERLTRIENGNFGDHKFLEEGGWELRFNFGSGYRIYYGQKNNMIILLSGGDKNSQKEDIEKAKKYWTKYSNK